MKKCSIVLVIWEMQIKCVVRYYYTLTRMAKIFKLTVASPNDDGVEQLKPSYVGGGLQSRIATLDSSLAGKHISTIQSRNSTPKYWSKRNKNISPNQTLCPNVYCTLIHNSPNMKQPKCSSAGIQINIWWYSHTMDYTSNKKDPHTT